MVINSKGTVNRDTTAVVLSAGQSPYMLEVLAALARCDPAPTRILLIWSGRTPPPPLPDSTETLVIPPASFDHGGTRQLALNLCKTPYLAFLSDDAVPVDERWLGSMLTALENQRVAIAFGRQVPRPDASVSERVFRSRRYPGTSQEFDMGSLQAADPFNLPISNANAVYRVDAVKTVGGFPERCSFGEDMVMTAALTKAGWRVRYVAEAPAWHSHSLSWRTTFIRGIRAGRVLPSERTSRRGGERLLRSTRIVLQMLKAGWREGGLAGVVGVAIDVGARVAGYTLGKLESVFRSRTSIPGS